MTKNVKVVKRATKRTDVKMVAKQELSALFAEFLEEKGIEVSTNAEDFAFTRGTIIAHMDKTDVQVKLITPKAGLDRYKQVVYVDEEEYEEIMEEAEAEEELIDEAELEELMEEMEMEDATESDQ